MSLVARVLKKGVSKNSRLDTSSYLALKNEVTILWSILLYQYFLLKCLYY